MKKVIFAFLCTALVMSCEIPQSVTIKGEPELSLSLGSPFANLKDDERIESKISPDKIREMMDSSGGNGNGVSIYDYQGDGSTVLTYLLHYPITEMKLDLEEYVNDAMKTNDGENQSFTIPAFIGDLDQTTFDNLGFSGGLYITENLASVNNVTALGNYNNIPAPLFTISLADMYRLVTEINGDQFAIAVDNISFADALEIWIEAFDIGDENNYELGTIIGNRLEFDGNKKQIKPREDLELNGELHIYAKIIEPCAGIIEPEMIFDWVDAKIDTSDEPLDGDYLIENSLGEFFGNGTSFNRVEGYMYVNGLDDSSGATMDLASNNNKLVNDKPLTNAARPAFPAPSTPFITKIGTHSLDSPIDLTSIFDASTAKLEYSIKIPEWEIIKNEIEKDGGEKVITADLVIILPLELKVSTLSSADGYVKLSLGDDLFSSIASGDLFGRTDSDDDDLFSQIEWVEIILNDVDINILDESKLALLLTAQKYNGILPLGSPILQITMDELPNPFEPQFEVLLKKDTGQNFGTLAIQRTSKASFDFSLALSVKTDIEQTITF